MPPQMPLEGASESRIAVNSGGATPPRHLCGCGRTNYLTPSRKGATLVRSLEARGMTCAAGWTGDGPHGVMTRGRASVTAALRASVTSTEAFSPIEPGLFQAPFGALKTQALVLLRLTSSSTHQ